MRGLIHTDFQYPVQEINYQKITLDEKKPEWTVAYGGQLYLNPGIPEVNDYVVNSIVEVVKNYDVDGVHMDDYFYPYKLKIKNILILHSIRNMDTNFHQLVTGEETM